MLKVIYGMQLLNHALISGLVIELVPNTCVCIFNSYNKKICPFSKRDPDGM